MVGLLDGPELVVRSHVPLSTQVVTSVFPSTKQWNRGGKRTQLDSVASDLDRLCFCLSDVLTLPHLGEVVRKKWRLDLSDEILIN